MKQFLQLLLTFLLALPFSGKAQTSINTYGRITAISGKNLTIANATGTFTPGLAIVMQMQDSVISTSKTNTSSFGNVDNIRSAGLSEMVSIASVSNGTVTLSGNLQNTYHTSVNARVQLISFPTLGTGDYTLSSSLTALAWNGNVGGVLAFQVNGTLTLNSNITVDGLGFRGGAVGVNASSDYNCDATTYYDNAAGVSTTYYGGKGEGIFNTNGAYTVAKGKIANGGGGGNYNNAGGGGGSNLTAGGTGGLGWSCTVSNSGGGVGGADLSSYISTSTYFMGGGGGGGQQNNGVGTAGANGGGIVMIKANTIKTVSGCSGGAINISAQGNTAANSGNDGAGGGGAGGSVVLDANFYSVSNSCPLTVNAGGGNGGTVNDGGTHGGGGGGGKGVVIFVKQTTTPTNVTTTLNAGNGGANSNVAGGSTAGGGSTTAGNSGNGIYYTAFSAMPVKLASFAVTENKKTALLDWHTATETNLARYEVERSVDNVNSFISVGSVSPRGDNSSYQFADNLSLTSISSVVYYRLRMVDLDGQTSYSEIKSLHFSQTVNVVRAFPVPARSMVQVNLSSANAGESFQVALKDMQGRTVKYFSSLSVGADHNLSLSLDGLTAGEYVVILNNPRIQDHVVIIKQ